MERFIVDTLMKPTTVVPSPLSSPAQSALASPVASKKRKAEPGATDKVFGILYYSFHTKVVT